jgi:hypothetical protein
MQHRRSIIIGVSHHRDSSSPGAIPSGSSLPWLLNDTAQATTESKPKPAVASRGLLPEPRRNLSVSQRLNEVKCMYRYDLDLDCIAKSIVFFLLVRVVVDVVRIALAIGNYAHVAMVAHGWVPK